MRPSLLPRNNINRRLLGRCGPWQAGFYAIPVNRVGNTVKWFSLHGKADQGGMARSVQVLKT